MDKEKLIEYIDRRIASIEQLIGLTDSASNLEKYNYTRKHYSDLKRVIELGIFDKE